MHATYKQMQRLTEELPKRCFTDLLLKVVVFQPSVNTSAVCKRRLRLWSNSILLKMVWNSFSGGPGALQNGLGHLFLAPQGPTTNINRAALYRAWRGNVIKSLSVLSGWGFSDRDKRTLFVRCLGSLRSHILIGLTRIRTEIKNNEQSPRFKHKLSQRKETLRMQR